jgi:hypothetical protein
VKQNKIAKPAMNALLPRVRIANVTISKNVMAIAKAIAIMAAEAVVLT